MDYLTILTAVGVSVFTGLFGYIKNTKPQDFDYTKFVATLIIGLIVGVGTSVFGMSALEVDTILTQGVLTIWIYWLAQLIVGKLGSTKLAASPTK